MNCYKIKELYNNEKYSEIIASFEHQVILSENELEKVPDCESQFVTNFFYGKACYVLHKILKATSALHYAISIAVYNIPNIKENKELLEYLCEGYYYKGSCLYVLKKYHPAIKCFEIVPDSSSLAVKANLYRGFCYQYVFEYASAEICFKKVIDLHKNDKQKLSCYSGHISQARRALVMNLIRQNKFEELTKFHGSASAQDDINGFDEIDNNLLMLAVYANESNMVKKLLEANADPFLRNKYGENAVSCAKDENKWWIVKLFLPDYDRFNDESSD